MIFSRIVLLIALGVHGGMRTMHAQDRIWVQPRQAAANQSDWYPQPIELIEGKITQFDADQLICRPVGQDADRVLPATAVIWIEPVKHSAIAAKAIEEFAVGRYAPSLQRLPEILRERPPVWYQQWFTSMAAVAASRSGHAKIALELIAQLDRRPLPPLVIAWLPIEWVNRPPSPDAQAQATARLDDPSALVRLVAASWLLSAREAADGALFARAKSVLGELGNNERSEIARFAEILSWRLATPPQVKQSAQPWTRTVDQLPMVWQTGPTQTLIDKFQSSGMAERSQDLQWSIDLTPIHPHP